MSRRARTRGGWTAGGRRWPRATSLTAAALSTLFLVGSSAGDITLTASEQNRSDRGVAASEPPPVPLGLGTPATSDAIAALDIDVRPDGRGLPPGAGTANDGAPVWARYCASCHGRDGEGGSQLRLVGPQPRTVTSYWPYATTIFDYINRAMPSTAPGTLSADQVYALTAWILAQGGLIDEETEMNATTLPQVDMPARDRFVPDDRRGGAEVR